MLSIKNYRQKYTIKFPQEIVPGEDIVIQGKGNICKFIRYDQGGGMGSFEYGDYGYLHYSDEQENCDQIMIYKNFPIIVKE